ncbi:PIN domain-containing protein [Ramlibacter sp. USB13]|uniref:PIN domain-containing protein n=1 Tax=Ramlibacter cellulosilyticus TaxID=2764187 RepID=A0A923SDN9_9BURK|nr:PIN domain-containing protein [Ramlibacter cellulosilyticus]MBC5785533.1 PIN domain-containing protein [Ramlibacter cellulosilyticus]
MRLVLDTNVVLDLLVFGDPKALPLKDGLEAGAMHWLATAAMREELARVLAYPKLAARVLFHRGSADAVLQDFDRHARLQDVPQKAPVTCGDPDDQKFIDLAVAHRCTLLSKDYEVLRMRKRLAQLEVQALPCWAS